MYPASWHRTWSASLREPELFVRSFCAEGDVSLEEEEGSFSLVFASCSYQPHGTFTFSLRQQHFAPVAAKIEAGLFFKACLQPQHTPPRAVSTGQGSPLLGDLVPAPWDACSDCLCFNSFHSCPSSLCPSYFLQLISPLWLLVFSLSAIH